MTIESFVKHYNLHDSYITSVEYSVDSHCVLLLIDFAFWMYHKSILLLDLHGNSGIAIFSHPISRETFSRNSPLIHSPKTLFANPRNIVVSTSMPSGNFSLFQVSSSLSITKIPVVLSRPHPYS